MRISFIFLRYIYIFNFFRQPDLEKHLKPFPWMDQHCHRRNIQQEHMRPFWWNAEQKIHRRVRPFWWNAERKKPPPREAVLMELWQNLRWSFSYKRRTMSRGCQKIQRPRWKKMVLKFGRRNWCQIQNYQFGSIYFRCNFLILFQKKKEFDKIKVFEKKIYIYMYY